MGVTPGNSGLVKADVFYEKGVYQCLGCICVLHASSKFDLYYFY